VERRADPGDRRARLLFMTDKAKPIFDKILLVGQETRTEALAGVADEDRDRMIDLLLRVRANLTQKAPADAVPPRQNVQDRNIVIEKEGVGA
jgi:DNA-binding MarR family transcriptional regulator